MNAETALQQRILAKVGASETHRLWRNATGLYYAGALVARGPAIFTPERGPVLHLGKGDAVLRGCTPVHAGLCVGSSDLVGILGPDGRFLGIELKTDDGRVDQNQTRWLEVVRSLGGIAGVARSVEDVQELLRGGGR